MRRSVLLLLLLAAGVQPLLAQGQPAPPTAASPTSLNDEVVASVRTAFTGLVESVIRVVPRLIATVLIVLVFWAIAALVRRGARGIAPAISDPTLRHLCVQVSFVGVWALCAVAVLDALGFDPEAVATGIGLTGIALGFALKDVLSNLVSGLLILMTRSFEIGDQIVVSDVEGTVEQIEVRVTHIRTYDGRLVLVPNAEIFTSRVINNTASPLRRATITVLLDYQQDVTLALGTMEAAARGTKGVAQEPAPSVRLRDLTPEHLVLEARLWTDAHRTDYMQTACAARAAIIQALKSAGVALPNPDTRVLWPGSVDRWRGVFDRKAEAQLS